MNAPALFMALFNGAWQGALLCLAAYGLLNSFRRLNAATRYAVWSALLAISSAAAGRELCVLRAARHARREDANCETGDSRGEPSRTVPLAFLSG